MTTCTLPLASIAPPVEPPLGQPTLTLAVGAARHDAQLRRTAIGPCIRLAYDQDGWLSDGAGHRVLALDTEGGSCDPATAALVSCCVRAMHRSGDDQAVSLYIAPDGRRQLQADAIRVHGLSPERLAALGALPPRDAIATIARCLRVLGGGQPPCIVGHCVAYDHDLLTGVAQDHGVNLPLAGWYGTYPSTRVLRDLAGPAERLTRNTLETFVRFTAGHQARRGVHTADGDVALLCAGLRAMANSTCLVAGPQPRAA